MSLKWLASITIFLILFLDQTLKIWIKTHFVLGEELKVFDWFFIYFIENNGMAFGLEFAGKTGKILLSVFRIIVTVWLGSFIIKLIRRQESALTVFCFSLIIAGAIGNIIDSTFYGVIFNDPPNQVATFLPEGGGYAPLLQGKVVDMFYFPLFRGFLPEWIPFAGGDYFIFFRPIFNVADSAITTGIFLLFLFYKKAFPRT